MDDEDEDYLFINPDPQWVPSDWLDYLQRCEVREDPDFVLPWNED